METAHERVTTLRMLREAPMKFPDGFEEKFPRHSKLIRLLMCVDAEKRPTASDLLGGGLLPPKTGMFFLGHS